MEHGKATRTAVGDCAAPIYNNSKPFTKAGDILSIGGKCWACGNPSHVIENDRATRKRKSLHRTINAKLRDISTINAIATALTVVIGAIVMENIMEHE